MSRSSFDENLRNSFIFIPAYNASLTLPKVIERIPVNVLKKIQEVLIVDNCSLDQTVEVAEEIKNSHQLTNLTIIRNEKNLGYGGSQKVAYRRFIAKGGHAIVMLHSDGQYAPELLLELAEPVLNGEADMVFGSRMSGRPLDGGMPLIRYLGNRFLTLVQNLLLGTKVSEFHSGYRVFSIKALSKLKIEQLSSDYHFDTEILILMVHHNMRIVEKPIPTHYGDEKNYVNIWKYGLQVLVTTGTYFLHRIGLRHSKRWFDRL